MTLPATVAVALLPSSPLVPPQWEEGNEEQLAAFWKEVEMEVLVLIEGEGWREKGKEGGKEGSVQKRSTWLVCVASSLIPRALHPRTSKPSTSTLTDGKANTLWSLAVATLLHPPFFPPSLPPSL